MYAVNKVTRAPIVATRESLQGAAQILSDTFGKSKTGELTFEYEGETKIDWDSQETDTDKDGEVLFIDENGDEIPESQIELVDEPEEEDDEDEDEDDDL